MHTTTLYFNFTCKILNINIYRKRKDVKAQLIDDLCIKYGYNEFLMQKFFDMFPLPTVSFNKLFIYKSLKFLIFNAKIFDMIHLSV